MDSSRADFSPASRGTDGGGAGVGRGEAGAAGWWVLGDGGGHILVCHQAGTQCEQMSGPLWDCITRPPQWLRAPALMHECRPHSSLSGALTCTSEITQPKVTANTTHHPHSPSTPQPVQHARRDLQKPRWPRRLPIAAAAAAALFIPHRRRAEVK